MAPLLMRHIWQSQHENNGTRNFGNWRDVNDPEALILEGWGQGCMFGALLIMAIITVTNMKRGVLLHKMILLEVVIHTWPSFQNANYAQVGISHEPWYILLHVF
jgi:hypothetical protein